MKRLSLVLPILLLVIVTNAQGIIQTKIDVNQVGANLVEVILRIDRTCSSCANKNCVSDSIKLKSDNKTTYHKWAMDTQYVVSEKCLHNCTSSGTCSSSDCSELTTVYREKHSALISTVGHSCKLEFSTYAGNRFTGYENLQFAGLVWVFTEFDQCQMAANSTPTVSDNGKYIIPLNAEYQKQWWVADKDSANKQVDSVYFQLTDPMRLPFVKVIWNASYSNSKPVYYDGFPNVYQEKEFPKGLHFDRINGTMLFKPVQAGQYAMAFMVWEYRNKQVISKSIVEQCISVADIPKHNYVVSMQKSVGIQIDERDTLEIPFSISGSKALRDNLFTLTGATNHFLIDTIYRDTSSFSGTLKVFANGLTDGKLIEGKFLMLDSACTANIWWQRKINVLVRKAAKATISPEAFGCDSTMLTVESGNAIDRMEFWLTVDGKIYKTKQRKVLVLGKGNLTVEAEADGDQQLIKPFTQKIDFDALDRIDTLDFNFRKVCYTYFANVWSKNPIASFNSLTFTYNSIPGAGYGDSIKFTYAQRNPLTLRVYAKSRSHCFDTLVKSLPIDSSILDKMEFENLLDLCEGDTFVVGPILPDTSEQVTVNWKNLPDSALRVQQLATIDTTYTFFIKDDLGCRSGGIIEVVVGARGEIRIGDFANKFCLNNDTVQLKVIPEGGFWTGTGVTDSQTGAYFSPALAGIGTWQLTYSVKDSGKTCYSKDSFNIEVFDTPFVNFGYLENEGPAPHRVYFYDSSAASVVSWKWKFGVENKASILKQPIFEYADTGRYNVTLTVSDGNGCSSSITKNKLIRVYGVGTNEPFSNLSIYPSPVSDYLQIGLNRVEMNSNYSIKSANGNTILTGQWNGEPIDVSSIADGMYFIQLQTDTNAYLGKFVKR
ncbi:MAG: T9SS type A sorting domain-containing protein [Bacteroidetes bacterium]|nr:T9SS type A sorting domain-containing protein [Bacteroidota bacterium]